MVRRRRVGREKYNDSMGIQFQASDEEIVQHAVETGAARKSVTAARRLIQ